MKNQMKIANMPDWEVEHFCKLNKSWIVLPIVFYEKHDGSKVFAWDFLDDEYEYAKGLLNRGIWKVE